MGSDGKLSEKLVHSFQARDIAVRENFVSLLYWLGITTVVDKDMGTTVFGVPNGAMREIAAQMFAQTYSDGCGIDQRLPAVNAGMRVFAKTGSWEAMLEPLLGVVKQNFKIRDAKEGETAVASAVSAILISAGGPYVVTREHEANDGYYDLAFTPRFDIAPEIRHAALVELKYLKKARNKPTAAELASIKAEAIRQLDQYSADPALAAKWRLKPVESPTTNLSTFQPFNLSTDGAAAGGGTVSLHRLVLVFRGGDCVLHEEV